MLATSAPKTKATTTWCCTNESSGDLKTIEIEENNFETVDNFSYLKSKITNHNGIIEVVSLPVFFSQRSSSTSHQHSLTIDKSSCCILKWSVPLTAQPVWYCQPRYFLNLSISYRILPTFQISYMEFIAEHLRLRIGLSSGTMSETGSFNLSVLL